MAFDDIKDWTYGTVKEVKEGEKKIVLETGEGALFPTPASGYYIIVWPIGQKPLIVPAIEAAKAVEAFRIESGGLSSDTFTWTSRKQLGTSERSIQVGDQVAAALTAEQIKAIQEATFTWRGEWNSVVSYNRADVVEYKGRTWTAKKGSNENHKPDAVVTQELATGTILAAMEVEENPFAAANWKKLNGATNKGFVNASGWLDPEGGGTTSGVYYSKESFSSASGNGLAARFRVTPEVPTNGQHTGIIFDNRTNPETETRQGYELRIVGRGESKVDVEVYKWTAGSASLLAKESAVKTEGTKTVWGMNISPTGVMKVFREHGGTWTKIFEVTDVTFSGPYFIGLQAETEPPIQKISKTELIEEIWWEAIATAPSTATPSEGDRLKMGATEPEWTGGIVKSASAFRNAEQKIKSGTNTRVKVDKAIKDVGSNFDLTNGWYVTPVEGWYQVDAQALFGEALGGVNMVAYIAVSGTIKKAGTFMQDTGGAFSSVSVSGAIFCKKEEKIEFLVQQNSGSEIKLFTAEEYNQVSVLCLGN